MASALISGLANPPRSDLLIRVVEPIAAARERLQATFDLTTFTDPVSAVEGADVVLLAVKPQIMSVVLGELAGSGSDESVFCFLGSLVWTALLAPPPGAKWLTCLMRAIPITPLVWGTIGLGTTFKETVRGGIPEWLDLLRMVFWVAVLTSWWLIPLATVLLWSGSRAFRSMGRAAARPASRHED